MSNLKRKPYFYDSQIKRQLVQIMSCFSGYQVKTGLQGDGKARFMDVPIIYGDMSQVASYLLTGGSENVMAYVPIMALYETGMEQIAEQRRAPQHVHKTKYRERATDADGNLLDEVPGRHMVAEYYQPVPYAVSLELAIWTSNKEQAFQLIEQICTVFNPEIDIKLSNSPTDPIRDSVLVFDGAVTYEKATPSATEVDPLYVTTLGFTTQLWLAPPVKVYELKPIYDIQIPIMELEEDFDFDTAETIDGLTISVSEDEKLKFTYSGN